MSPFQVTFGFEPDLPSPLVADTVEFSLEDYEDQLEHDPESIIVYFQSL